MRAALTVNKFELLNNVAAQIDGLDFYNYFHHGVDFLISGQTHVVRKIIIHSNVVWHILPLRNFFLKAI